MISQTKGKTVTIVLDGEDVEVPAGSNLVDAAALHSSNINHEDIPYHFSDNLAQLAERVFFKVNTLAPVHQRMEYGLSLGGGEHECVPREVKVENVIVVAERGAILWVGVEDGQ